MSRRPWTPEALDRGCRDPHCIGVLHGLDLARTAIAKAEG